MRASYQYLVSLQSAGFAGLCWLRLILSRPLKSCRSILIIEIRVVTSEQEESDKLVHTAILNVRRSLG